MGKPSRPYYDPDSLEMAYSLSILSTSDIICPTHTRNVLHIMDWVSSTPSSGLALAADQILATCLIGKFVLQAHFHVHGDVQTFLRFNLH